jgi:hypothetical protein
MQSLKNLLSLGAVIAFGWVGIGCALTQDSVAVAEGQTRANMSVTQPRDLRTYELTTTAGLRDDKPPEKQITFSEAKGHATLRTGNVLFDGLYAMAVHEALQNSVAQIKDGAYGKGRPVQLEAYQTGEFWTYVWTRDLSYSVYLALAGFDSQRAINSLLFKSSVLKPSVASGFTNQIIQDTGSGGSYPVSSDRVVWALGAGETLNYLHGAQREDFLNKVYPILHDTIEQDRRLVFDPSDGLYRGEQSFLDWREQTYPGWTRDNVLPIAMSKALSVNTTDYFLLKTAAAYAKLLGRKTDASRYAAWAGDLKASINQHFFDPEAGLYSTCLFSDGVYDIRVHRYDLLGESLAILLGVADPSKAEAILKNYPVGPHGPPVVWPQERTVPIYHNQAIWPFVTAFWTKAARKANYPEAVNLGIRSLEHLAAFNLSNMENFDFVTGLPEVKGKARNGPVVNSRRQLWSVAGYLAMVQDVVFGLETSWDGIRFRPFITAKLRNETFPNSNQIELRDFAYRNTLNQVRVHLPPANAEARGVCGIQRVELNGKNIGDKFATADSLQPVNQWDIYLKASKEPRHAAPLRMVDVSNDRAIFGPVQPAWDDAGQGAITYHNGSLTLHYHDDDAANVLFNIYRDGQLCARHIRQTQWTDPSTDYLHLDKTHYYSDGHIAASHPPLINSIDMHYYTVEALDAQSGNASHLTPPRCYRGFGDPEEVIPARNMQNRGGTLVAGHHFENWGEPGDQLLTSFMAGVGGQYVIRAEFANGSGPVNTGITCAVKKLEVRKAASTEVLASGYLVMPQSGDWKRWDMSTPVSVNFKAGEEYSLCISEDEYCRNMSYLKNNERYTALPGGGEKSCNYVNIAALHLFETLHQFKTGNTVPGPQAK